MKKVEAMILAPEKSKLIIDYIIEILSSLEKIEASMNFGVAKIDNQSTCVLDIYAQLINFEKHLNLEITSNHYLILYEQLLNDLLEVFLDHETIGVTKYYSIKSMKENFSGINAVNSSGSRIKINLHGSGRDFMNLIDNYTEKYTDFENRIKNNERSLLK